MLIPEFLGLKFRLVLLIVNFLENILESAIVLFKNSVFGAQVKRVVSLQRILEAGVGELSDRFVGVVHREHHATGLKLVNLKISGLRAVIGDERHDELAGFLGNEVSSTILVTKSMAANDDRLGPARNEPRDILDDDWFAEHSATKDVSDGTIGGLPHKLEVEFLHTSLISGDRGTLDANSALFDGVGRINGDLIVSLVSVFDAQVVVADIKVQEGMDKLNVSYIRERHTLSLMSCQMIRVISSPSMSTTAFVTLILLSCCSTIF